MKTVVNKEAVAHLWANRLQSNAKSVSGGRLYFNEAVIYSYGSHFPIAKHVENEAGKRVVLFTNRSYSNTTATHISVVSSACSHLDKIIVSNPNDSFNGNMNALRNSVKNTLAGLVNCRKPEKYISPAENLIEDGKKYAEFLGKEFSADISDILENAKNGTYKEYLEKERERIEKEKQEREAKEIKEAKKQLTKWRKGKIALFYGRLLDRDYLRINSKGQIQTSQNIEIPVEIAKRANKWIKIMLNGEGCIGNCDYKILDYEVKEVNKDFIHIGCHKIDHTEINKIAKKLQWK